MAFDLGIPSSDFERINAVHGFDSLSIAQFPAMIFSVSAEGFLNCLAHSI